MFLAILPEPLLEECIIEEDIDRPLFSVQSLEQIIRGGPLDFCAFVYARDVSSNLGLSKDKILGVRT